MISVIVPAYNAEDCVEASVKSILNSTFKDFELIIVNDGSTDRTAEICNGFEATDHRVHVIHQMNAGVADARNQGLNASQGDFITFVDADDLIHPTMLDVLMSAISSGDFDMSMVLHRRVEEDERERYLDCRTEELGDSRPSVLSQEDYVSAFFQDRQGFYTGPGHKLFKRELLLDGSHAFLKFKPISAEDTDWLIRVSLRMNKCILVPLDLYYYVMRSSSLTHAQSERGINSVIAGRLQTFYSFLDFLPEDKPHYKTMCLDTLYRKIPVYSYLANGTSFQGVVRTYSKDIYKGTFKEYLKSPVDLKTKAKNIIYYHCPWVFRSVVCLSELVHKCKIHA